MTSPTQDTRPSFRDGASRVAPPVISLEERKFFQQQYNCLEEELKALAQDHSLAHGLEMCSRRSDMLDTILRRVYEFTKASCPCGGDVALLAVGGYGRGEMTASSDVDLAIIESAGREKNQDFLLAFQANLYSCGREIPMLRTIPMTNTIQELCSWPFRAGIEETGDSECLDIRKVATFADMRCIAGSSHISEAVNERLVHLRYDNQAAIALHIITNIQRARGLHPGAVQRLDNFHIKDGYGGLREVVYPLLMEAAANRSTALDQQAKMSPVERNAFYLILHVREWLRWQRRDLLASNKLQLSFGHDCIPPFEYHFGRSTLATGAIPRLQEARKHIAGFCDRLIAERLAGGVSISKNTWMRGVGVGDNRIGVALRPTHQDHSLGSLLVELLGASTEQQIPIFPDQYTLSVLQQAPDTAEPLKELLGVLGSPHSPISGLQFLVQRGYAQQLWSDLAPLASSFYPSGHRLTGESLLDRAMERVANLAPLYAPDAVDSALRFFALRFQGFSQEERAALLCALFFEELPLVFNRPHKQPRWRWDEAGPHIDSCIDAVFARLSGDIKGLDCKAIQGLTKEIIRNKFLLRSLAGEILPINQTARDHFTSLLRSHRLPSLLLIFSFAAFDFQKPEDHPHARLQKAQWDRLMKIAEYLEKIFVRSEVAPSMLERVESLSPFEEHVAAVLASRFGTKIRSHLRKLSQVAAQLPSLEGTQISADWIDGGQALRQSGMRKLELQVYTVDRKKLLRDMITTLHEQGLETNSVDALTFSHPDGFALVMDTFDVLVPKGQAADEKAFLQQLRMGLLRSIYQGFQESEPGEVHHGAHTGFIGEGTEAVVQNLTLSQKFHDSPYRLSLQIGKDQYVNFLPYLVTTLSDNLGANILMMSKDQKWATSPSCEVILLFTIPGKSSLDSVQARLCDLL